MFTKLTAFIFIFLSLSIQAQALTFPLAASVIPVSDNSSSNAISIPVPSGATLFQVRTSTSLSSTDRFGELYKNGFAYKIPAGSTFHTLRLCSVNVSNAGSTFQLVSATAAIGTSSPSSLTNGVFEYGVTGKGGHQNPSLTVPQCEGLLEDWPAAGVASFLGFDLLTTGVQQITITGYETTP